MHFSFKTQMKKKDDWSLVQGFVQHSETSDRSREGWRTLVVRSCSVGRVSLRARRPCWTRSFRLPEKIEDTVWYCGYPCYNYEVVNEIREHCWVLISKTVSHILTLIRACRTTTRFLIKNSFFSIRVNKARKGNLQSANLSMHLSR